MEFTQEKYLKIVYKEDKYSYTDVYVTIDGIDDAELRYGCPTSVKLNTKLGKLLLAFEKIDVGTNVDPEKILVGKRVSFQTLNEETKSGTFARIVVGSIKPIVQSAEVK